MNIPKKVINLRKKVIDYQSQRRAALDKITTQRAKARETLIKKIEPILNSYIKENNISLVIDKKVYTWVEIQKMILQKLLSKS